MERSLSSHLYVCKFSSGAFLAVGHGYVWGERKSEFANFTYLAQSRNWE